MICVSLIGKTLKEAASSLEEAQEAADMVEIRLDALLDPALMPFLEKAKKPLLFTFRAQEEGGFKEVSLQERLSLLKEAATASVYAVDLELSAGDTAIRELKACCQKTKLVLSFHDFRGTPSLDELKKVASRMQEKGADIGKIVTFAYESEEALIPLNLIPWAKKELGLDLIAFAMGEAGKFSRLVCLLLGSPWSYAALKVDQKAAPGQIDAQTMRKFLDFL